MINNLLAEKAAMINEALDQLVQPQPDYPEVIFAAMRYSLLAGGKRLRPILLMASAEALGQDGKQFINVAAGLEMIHTYSLIHDDLPAMDDDDYRRGRPTCHKVFGEAIAILAGDALLTKAFETIAAQKGVPPTTLLQVIREIAVAAGACGMVGGQVLDISTDSKPVDAASLKFLHQAKTGALFRAAVRAGAILAQATERELTLLTQYADHFGLAFQITDDILDVIGNPELIGKPVGSDAKNHKQTYVTLYTLEGAKQMAQHAVDNALDALSSFGSEADTLRQLVSMLTLRTS